MKFAVFVLCWILALALTDRFAFADSGQPGPWMPTDTSLCPGGICPAGPAATMPAAYGDHRPVARAGGRAMRAGGRVLRGAGRVLTAPFRLFRGCRRGGC